jgi:hypothetical protein
MGIQQRQIILQFDLKVTQYRFTCQISAGNSPLFNYKSRLVNFITIRKFNKHSWKEGFVKQKANIYTYMKQFKCITITTRNLSENF